HRLLSVALVTLGLLGILFISLGSVNVNWLSKISLLSSITAVFPQSLIILPGTSTLGVHANQLAGTLLYFIPFVLSIWIGLWVTRPSKWRWFGWSLLVIFVIGLLTLTQSRTGWLAFALSLLSVLGLWGLVLSRQQQMYRYIWIAFGLFLFIGFAGLVWIGPDRLQSFWTDPVQETAVGNFSSIGFRQEVWRWGVTAAADFPFTGTGLGSFRQVVRRLYPLNVAPDYDIAHAHNIFLQTALDVGIPGLIVYLGIIGLAIVLGWIVARQNERLRPYAIGALGSVAAFHFFGLADAIAPGSKPHLILWIVLGLITAMHRLTAVK
ncbi:MAG: hypothetical protein GY796_19630, partial [Chloroflexi bacterium]|nr:hypothetical protein [Chloroflexota bacterium]